MSPDLFNLYSEDILRNLSEARGLIIGGCNINNLRYADDIVLIADSREKLQEMLDIINTHRKAKGLSINLKKTERMSVSKMKNPPVCSISLGANIIKQVDSFIYLGTVMTHDGKCDEEIKRRIALAKTTFSNLSKVFKNKRLSLHTKRRQLKWCVRPVLLYGSECWTITDAMKKKLEATEMWFYRKILRISYIAHVKN